MRLQVPVSPPDLLCAPPETSRRPPSGGLSVTVVDLRFRRSASGSWAITTSVTRLPRRAAAEDELAIIADLKVRQVSAWYDERLRNALFSFCDPDIAGYAARLFADPSAAEPKRQLLSWMASAHKNFHLGRVLLIDRDRKVRLVVPTWQRLVRSEIRSRGNRVVDNGPDCRYPICILTAWCPARSIWTSSSPCHARGPFPIPAKNRLVCWR